MDYQSFLDAKLKFTSPTGIKPAKPISKKLFPFQRDIVAWALRKGRAAIFADTGMGKSAMQLEWAKHIDGEVLILAPLAVAQQTVREGVKFGIKAAYCRKEADITERITITNYEMVEKFDVSRFAAVVLDESSILKSQDSATRALVIELFKNTKYKLCCTATPAPNDFMELGNHSEFLQVLSRPEMLAMFFVHDGGETQKWRLKGHAEKELWKWVCSWAVTVGKPSDLGYSDDDYALPPLTFKEAKVYHNKPMDGFLIPMEASSLQERIQARRETVTERAKMAAEIVASKPEEQWLIWCNLNAEAEAFRKFSKEAIEIRGDDSLDYKADTMLSFAEGKVRVLVTKPSIAGHGLNWQNCHNVIFLGLSDSFEEMYQATRRCWRYGQESPVDVWIVTSNIEGAVVRNIRRKEEDFIKMRTEMVELMKEEMDKEIHGTDVWENGEYKSNEVKGKGFTMIHGDCVEEIQRLETDSIDYSVFSPPFASLYTYTASQRDMGNCKDHEQFFTHFQFLIKELYRTLKPGRLLSFHCMNLPTSKQNHGYIGIIDFRGELIRRFTEEGFIYHSEVCIWKDPVTAMQRTKALGLLHKQLKKDSCMSRQGIPDYLVTMRKPGENPEPVSHTNETFPVKIWQQYASPVWMDINPSKTLQYRSAREEKDERHICPLQLEVIERALKLWTNPGDVVFSPFAGIGSEGYVSINMGRKFYGIELKESYFKQACRNLTAASQSDTLFNRLDSSEEEGETYAFN